MLPHNVVRKAADLIRTGGHSQGCHARDAQGNEVPLFTSTKGTAEVDTSRASLNSGAAAFSIYGALVAAIGKGATSPTPIWNAVREEAERTMEGKAVGGGTNFLHPVFLLNEHMDTTKEDAVAFLERVAVLLEPAPKQVAEVSLNG